MGRRREFIIQHQFQFKIPREKIHVIHTEMPEKAFSRFHLYIHETLEFITHEIH